MPAWIEIILTPLAIYATLFILTWALARDRLSRRARLLGWTAVGVTTLSLLWSLWQESLFPYLRLGRQSAALRAMLQATTMLAGAALALYGATRFLRAWWQKMFSHPPAGRAFGKYARGEHPHLARIRSQPTLRERFILAWKWIAELFRLPGLGWVGIGVGIAIAAGQLLEADRFFTPDSSLLILAVCLMLVGGGQIWAAHRRKRQGKLNERAD